jgi:hypothetical protein
VICVMLLLFFNLPNYPLTYTLPYHTCIHAFAKKATCYLA